MPHSNRDSASSTDTFDLTGPMTSTANYLNDAGVGRAISPNNQHQSPLQTDAWKRRSLPNTGLYAEYIDKSDLDELLRLRDPNQSARNRNSFHEDQLQQQDKAMAIARDRAQRESPIIAELRTNVIVKDEFTLVTDLSRHLAQRYARSDSAIMVKVDHSACIALGGTFDPCYILTITNISTQMGPAMNKRNATLIQSFMADILSVPPDRGILKFHAMTEENLATNGTTVLGEIERQEKQQLETSTGSLRRAPSTNSRKSLPSMKKSNSRLDSIADEKPSILLPDITVTNGLFGPLSGSTASLSPTVTITPANVFENQPINENPKPTSKGVIENGLRMNPVTSNDVLPSKTSNLQNSRLPNGRPKTISAEQHQEPVRLASLPQRQSFSSTNRTSRPPSFLKSDPNARNPSFTRSNSSQQSQSAPSSRHGSIPEQQTKRESYYESYYGTTIDIPSRKNTITSILSTTASVTDRESSNTAKRRSTITATPKFPLVSSTQTSANPMSPPGSNSSGGGGGMLGKSGSTASNKAQSAKSLKVGKRKSFLAAFRRGATTAA